MIIKLKHCLFRGIARSLLWPRTGGKAPEKRRQHCWMCCVRLHTLLHVVGCCCAKFETGHNFSPVQTDARLFANNSQHCWELLRPFARSLSHFSLSLHLDAASRKVCSISKQKPFRTENLLKFYCLRALSPNEIKNLEDIKF